MRKQKTKRLENKLRVRHTSWGHTSREQEQRLQHLESLRREMEAWR